MLRRERLPMNSCALGGPFEATARVEGMLPEWLDGQLMRTAPAVFAQGAWRAEHWFDALGVVFAFELSRGGVAWHQRLLGSRVASAAAEGRVPFAQFGTPNGRSLARRIVEPVSSSTDNANVNIVPWADAWLAMTETEHQLVVDPVTLRAAPAKYDDDLPSHMWMTAHPSTDARTGALLNVGTHLGRTPSLIFYEQARESWTRRIVARWPTARLPYMHSFGVCDEVAVIIGHPFDVDPRALLWSNDFVAKYEWHAHDATRLVAIDRHDGSITEYEAPAMFVFHVVSTFRDGRYTVVDVLAYESPSILTHEMRVDQLEERAPDLRARLTRLRLTPGERSARVERLSDSGFEFPIVDRRATHGRAPRFVWGASISPDSDRGEVLCTDLRDATVLRFGRRGVFFGEPVFVRCPSAEREGDGVLLSVGSHRGERLTTLAVLEARTLEPLAEVTVAVDTPLGFHGAFKRAAPTG